MTLMSPRELAGHIPAAQLIAAAEVMGTAEIYAAVGQFADGFALPAHLHEAARELVRVGLLTEVGPYRFVLAPSREIVL